MGWDRLEIEVGTLAKGIVFLRLLRFFSFLGDSKGGGAVGWGGFGIWNNTARYYACVEEQQSDTDPVFD